MQALMIEGFVVAKPSAKDPVEGVDYKNSLQSTIVEKTRSPQKKKKRRNLQSTSSSSVADDDRNDDCTYDHPDSMSQSSSLDVSEQTADSYNSDLVYEKKKKIKEKEILPIYREDEAVWQESQ